MLTTIKRDEVREEGGIHGFLQEISLLTDTNRWDTEAEKVSLMTIHSAKGLEFDKVAVVGNEEGLFPHARSFEDPKGLEEERRLFYVALTRARKEIMLTHAKVRYRTGAPGPTSPSRFFARDTGRSVARNCIPSAARRRLQLPDAEQHTFK
ncbi:MAG TPA: hypothetical protein EYN86_02630 [Planctomycetes bacterium]|nr:hypothetical protein [Planctomycetota bacterium]